MSYLPTPHEYDSRGYCTKCHLCNNFTSTSHCPETEMTVSQFNKVYTGEMDFRFGTWVASSFYISSLFPKEALRNESIVTRLMISQNKVIPLEAYKNQKRIINAYDNIIKSN